MITNSSGATIITYNAFGEVRSVTDAENRVTTYEYDELGRVKTKTSPDGVATNTWDTAPLGVGKLAIGKLAEARSSDGVTIGHTYDELGKGCHNDLDNRRDPVRVRLRLRRHRPA